MSRKRQVDSPEMPIAPMIDCVFLMLVYFMTTSSLEKSEADLTFPAGVAGSPADPLHAVDEQHLTVSEQAIATWNGSGFSLTEGLDVASLILRLKAFKGACEAAGSDPSVRLTPAENAPHQAIVTLLDSIMEAEIESIHFP